MNPETDTTAMTDEDRAEQLATIRQMITDEEIAPRGSLADGLFRFLLGEVERLTAKPITQYGLRLRDSTLLDFATKAQRDRRMAEFVDAEWEVTPLTRQVLPARYSEWTEEAR